MTYLEVNDTVRVEYRGAVALKCRVQAFDDKTVTLVTMEGAEVVYGHHDGVIDAKHDVARVGVLDRAEYAEYVPDKRVTITFTRHALVKGVVRANDGGLLTIQPDNYPNPIYLDLAHLPPEVTSVVLTDMVNLEVEEHTLYEKLINDLPKHKRTPEALATVRLTVKRFAELVELSPPPMASLRWIMPKVKVEGPPVVETFEGVVFDVTRVHSNKSKVGTYIQRFVEGDRAEVASYIQCPKLVPFSTVSLPATSLYRRANLNQQFATFFKAANYLYRTTPPGPINLAPKFTAAFTVFDVIAALEPYRMYTLPFAYLKKVRSLIDTAVRLHLERVPRLDSKKNSRVVGTLTDHPGSASEQLAHMMRRDYGFGSLGAPRRSAQWVRYQEYRNAATDRTMAALAKSAAPSSVPTKVLELLATYAALKGSLAFIEQHARASKPEESADWLYFVDDDITEHKFVPVFVTTILRQKGSLHDVFSSLLASKKAVILDNLIVDVHSGYSMPYLEEVATNEASPVPPDVVVPKISGGDLPQLSILKKLSHYLSIDTEPHYADIVSSARGKDHVFAVAARLVELGQPLSAVARAVVAISKTRRNWQKDLTLAQVQFRISEHLRPTPVLAPPKEVEWVSFLPLSTIPELHLKPIDGLHQYELIRGKLAKFGAELTRQVREGSPTQAVLQYIEQLERHQPPIATLYQFGTKRRITIKEHPAAEYPVIEVEPTPVAKDPSILERLKTCLALPTGDIADLVPKCPPLVLYNFIVFAALTVPNLIKHKYRNFKEGEILVKTDKVARLQSTELLNGMNSRLFPTEGDYTEQDAFVTKCNVQRKHLQEIVARASDEGALKYCLMQVFDTFITDPEGKLLDDPEYAHAVVHACVERLKSEVDNLGDHRRPV
jgi:hypothetical protein